MFKKTIFQIHWLLGITAGLVLSIMGVTGAIYSYQEEILKILNPKSYVVVAQNIPKLTPSQLYNQFIHKNPQAKIKSITINKDPTLSSIVTVTTKQNFKGENLMVNPYTAEQLPKIKGKDFFSFILNVHRSLTAGEFGKQITGACALILLFFIFSGLYLRWPKKSSFKQWLMIKPKLKGRNFLWDLHAVIGTWVLVFYLVFATTGLFWAYDWWRNGMFAVLNVKHEPFKRERPHFDDHPPIVNFDQAWQIFNHYAQQQYSSVTFNLPQKNHIEINFVDPIPQHERAKNTLSFNLNTQQLDKINLYRSESLNEKIMTSMLPVHRGSFFGPIWRFLAMIAALAMPLFFITGWMLYLKRRKQKKLVIQAKKPMTTQIIPIDAPHWTIVYASQTGNAEQLAWQTTHYLQQALQNVTTYSIEKVTPLLFEKTNYLLFIVSTYGTGDAPDIAQGFIKKYLTSYHNLEHIQFAVLALGSKEYLSTYCYFGHQIFEWLKKQGAQPICSTIEVDNKDEIAITQWNHQLSQITNTIFEPIHNEAIYDDWTLAQRHHLNANSLGEPIYHLEFCSEDDIIWQAGDIAQIQPQNNLLKIEKYIQTKKLLKTPELIQYLQDRMLDPNYNLENLPKLPIREYSIASIPQQKNLQLVVRLNKGIQEPYGLGSGWLCQYMELNQTVKLRIRKNPAFHLIQDDRPIILIGNGTGISSLLALLQERRHGKNWLIFGERQKQYDFLYQDKILKWYEEEHITALNTAFSRDNIHFPYVQHQLYIHAKQLQKWVEQDAVIYVCGSAIGMGQAVHKALIEILGEQKVDQLILNDRYKRDVY